MDAQLPKPRLRSPADALERGGRRIQGATHERGTRTRLGARPRPSWRGRVIPGYHVERRTRGRRRRGNGIDSLEEFVDNATALERVEAAIAARRQRIQDMPEPLAFRQAPQISIETADDGVIGELLLPFEVEDLA